MGHPGMSGTSTMESGLYVKGKNFNRVQFWKCILPKGRAFALALSYPVFLEGEKTRTTKFSLEGPYFEEIDWGFCRWRRE